MRFFLLILALFLVLPASGQTPAIHFRNVNREVGIPMPGRETSERKYIIQQMSGGVALFDCDNDGKLDIAVVNESTIDHYRKSGGDLMLTL